MAKLEFARHEVEDFVNNRVWKYIVATMAEKVSTRMENNNSIDPFKDPSAICRNQGAIEALEEITDIPSIMAQTIEFESKVKEKEEEREEDGRE